jgi:hypothetical protein
MGGVGGGRTKAALAFMTEAAIWTILSGGTLSTASWW